ncbi:MAG TPA: IclR family transcriptional regulator [Rectinemataceae bacterium]|nr:IclR family transcriptional regulator [Rectinemataceae bacterium]
MGQTTVGSTEKKTSVRSLEKALDLLDYLEKTGSPRGVRAIEMDTGIPKATAQRLLEVLESKGFVRKHEGKYALWVGALHLARSFKASDGLTRSALPIMRALVESSEETCSLYVRQGLERILVERVESPHPLRFQTPIGERLPLHIGASGLVLCAGMPDAELGEYISTLEAVRLADGTLLSQELLAERIRSVRHDGFAIGVGERLEGMSSVAAPVDTKDKGIIAAINIAGPSTRMDAQKLERLSIELRGAARELGEAYGHSRF